MSTQSKHTPGPWHHEFNGYAGTQVTINHPVTGHIVSVASVLCGNAIGDAWKANARLIAAAPELLEACETVVNDCDSILNGDDLSGMSDQELFTAIKRTLTAAIAKATGQS